MINVLQVQVWLQRQLFLAQARVQLYEILLLQLRNRRGVDTALENIREVYSKGEPVPTPTRNWPAKHWLPWQITVRDTVSKMC